MMDDHTKMLVREAHWDLPEAIRHPPASPERLAQFEARYQAMPSDFRWYLLECGGGVVGSEWVDDLEKLFESHAKYREEFGRRRGWTMSDVFIIGWDGAGNPYGIQESTGKILVEDHNFAGIYEMAESFESFLRNGLLEESSDSEK